jgi:hypothetical protein
VILALCPAASWAALSALIAPVVLVTRWQYRRDHLEAGVRRHPARWGR